MANEVKISGTKLLYDPIFAAKPDVDMKGKKNFRFKIVFIILISVFVGISLYFSFNSLSSDTYVYKEADNGYQLYQFNGNKENITLHIDYVRDEHGTPDETKTVSTVREFAMSCNEYVQFIFIGKDVAELEPHCFYYTKNLKAVIVDEDNQYFKSVDGVLYNKNMTEIILHPMKNDEYRAALKNGIAAPVDEDTADTFIYKFEKKYGTDDEERSEQLQNELASFAFYDIPKGVIKIADSCFSDCETLRYVTIPSGVKEIGSLAFFKCTGFETINIPDGVESIGSDGFSYCEKVTYIFVPASVTSIGHHAFYGDLGCEKIYLGSDNPNKVETGENWLPKQSTRSLKDVEAVYGQKRRAE